ncbi:hypothetical protein [Clostridium tertium]|uniref:Uncharacterized protein n=1 Tax=Clostridium tertium TaxID=1559 RepID=A0A6N3A852_9CLOT
MYRSSYKLRCLREDRSEVSSAKTKMRNTSSDVISVNNKIRNAANYFDDVFKCNSTQRICSNIERINFRLKGKIDGMVGDASSLIYQIDQLIDNEISRLNEEDE